jgi:hypothetical protein
MSLRNLIEMNKKHLTHMIETNKKHEFLKAQRDDFKQKTTQERQHLNSVKILSGIIENCRASYSAQIINSITSSLTNCLDVILQDKKYDAEIEIYQFMGRQNLRLWLVDESGLKLPPNIVEGDMLNQVLSFCASVILTRLSGYKWFFYDEAFASANPRSIILIRRLLRIFLDEGFNFVFVSQNPLLFTEFDRNLIELIQEGGSVSEVKQTLTASSNDASLDERALDLHDFLLRGSP